MGAVADYINELIFGPSPNAPDYSHAIEDVYIHFLKDDDPINQFGGVITLGKDEEWEAIEYPHTKKKRGKTRDGLNEDMMKLIPIGVCIRCQTLMYLGMTNCSKCGAPVGESIDLEALQEKVQELLKPETEVIYKNSPQRGAIPMILSSSDECMGMAMYSTSSAECFEYSCGTSSEAY